MYLQQWLTIYYTRNIWACVNRVGQNIVLGPRTSGLAKDISGPKLGPTSLASEHSWPSTMLASGWQVHLHLPLDFARGPGQWRPKSIWCSLFLLSKAMLCHAKRFHTFGHMKAIYIKDHGSFFLWKIIFSWSSPGKSQVPGCRRLRVREVQDARPHWQAAFRFGRKFVSWTFEWGHHERHLVVDTPKILWEWLFNVWVFEGEQPMFPPRFSAPVFLSGFLTAVALLKL